jgi:hypothetical protein
MAVFLHRHSDYNYGDRQTDARDLSDKETEVIMVSVVDQWCAIHSPHSPR